MIAQHVMMSALGRSLFFRGAHTPELDESIGIALQQFSKLDVRLGAYDVGIGGHDFDENGPKKGGEV
jgi:hypothetical protein